MIKNKVDIEGIKSSYKSYEVACQELADSFVKKYWGKTEVECFWVGDHVGGTLFVNDEFIGMNDISEFIRNKYTRKEFFEYLDYRGEFYAGEEEYGSPLNIYSWRKLGK